ncbi:MAG TPA: hypothetical protein VM053_06135 [Gemmatimonadaceae bacterium]|nr:hypothetical protein [Gemmatimonadaceae bacterium]
MGLARFFPSLSPPDLFAIAFALGITVLIAMTFRHRSAAWVIASAAYVPLPVVALFSAQYNLVGWHAFMHVSPIYQMMARGVVPPEDPVYAGGTLRYPWVEHWLIAQVSRFTGANVNLIALCAEAVAFLVFLGAVAWLASTLTRDRVTIALASLISGYGISVFHSSFFAEPLQRAFPPLWLETRVVPVDKFVNLTAAPIGYAAMVVAAAATVRLVCGLGSARRLLLLIASCTLVAALIHPLSWLGVLAFASVGGFILLVAREGEDVRHAIMLAAAVGVPSALCWGYLRSVGASESSGGWMGISTESFRIKVADLALFLVTFAVLAYLHRAELIRWLRSRNRAAITLLSAIGFLAVAYLFVRMPMRNEYKFLIQLVPAAAVIMAISLRRLLDTQRGFALALLFLLLLPGGRILGQRPWFKVTDPVRMDGRYIRAVEPGADELYEWVAAHTPQDAVFIAPDIRIPPLGRRTLYIVVDAPWRGQDGWGVEPMRLLQFHVRHRDSDMSRRQRLAAEVLGAGWTKPPVEIVEAIQGDVPGRPLFVHAADSAAIAKLNSTPGFSREFSNAAGSIYAVSTSFRAASTSTERVVGR